MSSPTARAGQVRDYYAHRRGAARPAYDLPTLRRLVCRLYDELDEAGWFQHKIGKDCVDAPEDLGAVILLHLGRELWPLSRHLPNLDEEWLFTILEFLHDHVAMPTASYRHNYSGCGLHVTEADEEAGRTAFRERVNDLLARYEKRYELTANGEIWARPPLGLEQRVPQPVGDPAIDDRVTSALRAFRRYGATDDDKRHAIHDLADVLERRKKSVGTQLPRKDESDLFLIANRFGIRHHDPSQRTDYDTGIWLDWIFYGFLNTIALVNHLTQPQAPAPAPADDFDLPF